jgi:hypothetical protein
MHRQPRKSNAKLTGQAKIDLPHRHHVAASEYWANEQQNLILHE